MPTPSQLQQSLKILDRMAIGLLATPRSSATRRFLAFLSSQRDALEAERYWERPRSYQPAQYQSKIDLLLTATPHEFRFLFRMTSMEFARLVERFGGDEVFISTGRRPQAAPKYQIALFVHRLAHGHEVKTEARLFGISSEISFLRPISNLIAAAGSVQTWTDRCIQAIGRHVETYIHWPSVDERYDLKSRIKSIHGIPQCIGFVDGCHVNLERAPTRPGKSAGAYHSRKERYGFNVVAAVDDKKRFIYLHWGYSAASSDQRVQRSMKPNTNPERFFEDGEWLLADAGFTCSPNIIPMYKRGRGQAHLRGRMVCHLCIAGLRDSEK